MIRSLIRGIIVTSLLMCTYAGYSNDMYPDVVADPNDVSSIDAIIKAFYDKVSGEAGPKNLTRYRSLYINNAQFVMDIGDKHIVKSVEDRLGDPSYAVRKESFYESEIRRDVRHFGNIAIVFSTYEIRRNKDDEKPVSRGINNFQLLNDGKRWWIVSLFWQRENDKFQLPEKYLSPP